MGGIIPARAGFTEGPPAAVPARRDHPRSRGVYRPQRQALHQRGGSSPLARGLHPAGPGLLGAGGIIPARAGFTPCCGPTPTRSWDHPRSRGVYTGARVPVCPPTGSSPLARGLRERPWEPRGRPRIIPARAGFTRARRRGSCRRRDHPRSRGVYATGSSKPGGSAGSSPLARGLRGGGAGAVPDLRIIPARAGFTQGTGRDSGAGEDHPRSRGVYRYRTHAYKEAYGSSPLARGLPTTDTPSLGERGIIPARAGFTCNTQTMSLPPHGSSPLARGLPRDGMSPMIARRIIPARAGFTRHRRSHPEFPQDHPRSRGVYWASEGRPSRKPGSSPLARGLQGMSLHLRGDQGIIPARAGFTRHDLRGAWDDADHPRSRGVYSASPATTPATSGSSPLARGLRSGLAPVLALPRIIPARAGFTLPRRLPGRRGPDHPRSRGVYGRLAYGDLSLGGSSPLARGLQGLTVARVDDAGIIPARAGFT